MPKIETHRQEGGVSYGFTVCGDDENGTEVSQEFLDWAIKAQKTVYLLNTKIRDSDYTVPTPQDGER